MFDDAKSDFAAEASPAWNRPRQRLDVEVNSERFLSDRWPFVDGIDKGAEGADEKANRQVRLVGDGDRHPHGDQREQRAQGDGDGRTVGEGSGGGGQADKETDSAPRSRTACRAPGPRRERRPHDRLQTKYEHWPTPAKLDALRSNDGETRYRRCASVHHHHHLVCRHCGIAIEVEGPEVERRATKTGGDNDFVDVTHTVEIIGTRPSCASAH
jgi:hypothetical protein